MNKNRKSQIVKIIAVSAVFMFLIFSYLKFYSAIKFLSSQIGGAERSIKILEEKRLDLDAGQAALKNFPSEKAIVQSAFLTEDNFVDFVNTLEGFGRQSGAKFAAREAKFPSDESSQVQFSFSLKGDFKSVFKFLFLLDNSQYSGILRKISLHSEGDSGRNFSADVDYLIFNFRI